MRDRVKKKKPEPGKKSQRPHFPGPQVFWMTQHSFRASGHGPSQALRARVKPHKEGITLRLTGTQAPRLTRLRLQGSTG